MKKAPTDDLLNKCILMLCDGAVDKLFLFFNNLILIFRGCLFTLLVLLFEATTTNKYYISLRKKYNLILMGLVIIHILHVILAKQLLLFFEFQHVHVQCNLFTLCTQTVQFTFTVCVNFFFSVFNFCTFKKKLI